ncbi:MAG: TIGR02147 family protein [Fibrobacteria bacterium]|nr:TIGR02147 family protein [Fibrobacteria bacterium]
MTTPSGKPDIFGYADGRQFLQDWWDWKKSVSPRTSFRSFGTRAGCSPSLLKDVLEGRRRLTQEASTKFGLAMGLADRERSFLAALAAFAGAKSPEVRNAAFAELTRLRHQSFVRYLDPRQYVAWTWWHHMAIRELTGLPGFQEDPAWIASNLEPPIKPADAAKALQELQNLGLLRRDDAGRLVVSDPAISSEYEVPSPVIRHFNQQMIQLGLTAPDRIAPADREISGLTLGISQECYDRMKERIRMFKQELLTMALDDRRPADLVAQMNVQLFPLARPDRRGRPSP